MYIKEKNFIFFKINEKIINFNTKKGNTLLILYVCDNNE